jgi:tripartite-type tricarboxylate transporter receptor subunit TctC
MLAPSPVLSISEDLKMRPSSASKNSLQNKNQGSAVNNIIFTRRDQRDYACWMAEKHKADTETRSLRNGGDRYGSHGLNAKRVLRLGNRALKWMFAAAVAVSLSAAGAARAADWPSNPIRVIVPYSAGSAADVVPRIVFEQVKEQLGQTIIVENKPGASGTIGAYIASQASPDGYTLLAASSGYTIAPATFPDLHYDPIKDFVGISTLGNMPNVLVISPSKHIRTVQALVAMAKTTSITFGSTGVGGPIYLTMERFRQAAGFKATVVPYKGAPQALTETIAGRIDIYYSPLLAALPFIRNGNLLSLAVSSVKRVKALPDVPTTLEAGYQNSNYNFWIGVFAPAKTPHAIIDRLNIEITRALGNPTVQQKLEKIGVQPEPMTVERFNAFIREELKTNAELAEAAGIAKH